MAPLDDFLQSFALFNQGLKEYGLSQAFANANQQVQELKRSTLKEDEKRQALYQIADQAVMHMASLGANEQQISSMLQGIGTPQFKDTAHMAMYGAQRGDQAMLEAASKADIASSAGERSVAMARMQNDPMRQALQDEKIKQFNIKQFKDLGKDLDQTAASSRSAFGVAGITDQRSDRMRALIGSPENIKNATDADMTLIAEGLANLVKGGVATEKEIESLLPKTRGSVMARAKQFLTNNPEPAQREQFIKRYADIVNREQTLAQNKTADIIMRRASANKKLASRDEDQFKLTVAESLKLALGKDIKPEDIEIPTKGPVRLSESAQLKFGQPVQIRDRKSGEVFQGVRGLDSQIRDSRTGKIIEM